LNALAVAEFAGPLGGKDASRFQVNGCARGNFLGNLYHVRIPPDRAARFELTAVSQEDFEPERRLPHGIAPHKTNLRWIAPRPEPVIVKNRGFASGVSRTHARTNLLNGDESEKFEIAGNAAEALADGAIRVFENVPKERLGGRRGHQ